MVAMSLSPPRLGFLIDDLEGRGGTELHLLTLLGGLHRAGFATELVILGRAGLAHLFEREGTRVHRWLVRRVITPGYPLLVARLAGLLRRRRFDLLETIHVAADLLGPPAAQAAGIPCVSSRRDLGIFRSPRHLLLSRLVRRFVTAFLAPSEAVRDFACR
ncbi:MAG: glycosyltransferase, partial [Deltaproteobacteria bacterium]|nr:glycosyltransferase [Deltaproteobacteria bacterium]